MARGENPGARVLANIAPKSLGPEISPDGIVLLNTREPRRLRAVWIGEGFPADVRRALDESRGQFDHDVVLTARRFSVGAIELLAERGLSWADAEGYAEISLLPDVFISRRGPRPLPQRATSLISWSASSLAVAEHVLARRVQLCGAARTEEAALDRVAQIAEATRLSVGQVGKVLLSFDEEGYTGKSGPERGPGAVRRLAQPGRLLSDWASHHARSARRGLHAELHVLSRDPSDWIRVVTGRLGSMTWGVSGWAAADLIAPFTTAVPDLLLYVTDEAFEQALDRLIADPDVTEVERGGRIRLRVTSADAFSFAERTDLPEGRGVMVLSPIRVYADLIHLGGRAAEAAEHLREVRIGF